MQGNISNGVIETDDCLKQMKLCYTMVHKSGNVKLICQAFKKSSKLLRQAI